MLDIPSISAMVAAIGVIVGVVFAVLELRNLVKTRQTDLVIKLYSTYGSKEFQQALEDIMTREAKDFDDYIKTYGWLGYEVISLFEGIGVLVHRKLIDISLVDDLFTWTIKNLWEKIKPIIEGRRR